MPFHLRHYLAAMVLLAILYSDVGQAAATNESSAWSYRAWQTDEGLPDNSVTGVAQTDDGYLWVATYGGLMRFNGASFTSIPLPTLQKKSICSMVLDRHGRLWLGIDPDGVNCLDAKESRAFGLADGLPAERVAAMAEDREGTVWVASQGALCRIMDNHHVTRFTVTDGWPAGMNAWVSRSAKGEVWYSKGGLVGVVRDGRLVQKLTFKESIVRICAAGGSGLWICAGSSLFKYEEDREPELRAQLPANAEPQVLFEDQSGELWVGTAADGLFRLENGVLKKVPTSHKSIVCVSQDREGNIWVGTRGGGLNLIQPSAVALIAAESGLPFESVSSVCEDSGGCRWAVSQNGILARCCNGRWDVLGTNDGWTGGYANCVAADKAGGVWMGTRNRTLHYFRDGIWRVWQRQDGLRGGSIHLVYVDTGNDVWIVTGRPSILQRLHNGELSEPFPLPGENRTVRAMAETTDGKLWLGTSEGGILRVEDSALVIEPATTEMTGVPIRALEATPDGSLWIGYVGGGVGRLKGGKYSRVTTAIGLADDFASQLLADVNGGMWIVGNHGLFRAQLDDLTAVAEEREKRLRCRVFGRQEGLPIFQPNTANFPNACKGKDGRLWFALRSGLLTVQPQNIRDNLVPPPVLVERVRVDDRVAGSYENFSQPGDQDGGPLINLRLPDAELRIPPEHRKVEFNVSTLSFTSPDNVHFRYRLENFDDGWMEGGLERSAKYPHLPAGTYRFHATACNNAGVWNETGATLTIIASPYFWQTWWFRGAMLALFTGAVIAVVRYVSFRRLRRQMQLLEQQAALYKERARIARDMHDEVGAKLTRLSLLSEMAGDHPEVPSSARGDVKEISETARETIRSFEEIVWAVNPRNDTLADLVNYLCRYVEDYFDGSPVQCAYDLPPEIPPAALSTEVRHEVFLAAKEALNNVLKHAGAKNVRVKVEMAADELRIIIADDGCGFDTASPPKRSGGGNGLDNMRERLRSVGGRLECISQPGQGTCIVFSVPSKAPAPR